jgi:hypothetical protein
MLYNKARERNKRDSNRERRNQIIHSCKRYDSILKDPKDSIKKLLDVISIFSNVGRYKFNIQKSVAFLYINSEQAEKEIRKTIPLTIA